MTTSDISTDRAGKQVAATAEAQALVKGGFGKLCTYHSDVRIALRGKNPMVVADCSGSMDAFIDDMTVWPPPAGMKSKFDQMQDALRGFPSLKVVGFDSDIYPDGLPPHAGGTTAMHKAFSEVKHTAYDSFICISDGYPDNPDLALSEAMALNRPVNVIYIGRKGDKGEKFMGLLAKATGGTVITPDAEGRLQLADFFKKTIAGLIGDGSPSNEKRGPIIL